MGHLNFALLGGLFVITGMLLVVTGCDTEDLPEFSFWEETTDHRADAMELIQERNALRVITGHNSVSYFLYRGVAMGYEYEMLMQLAYEMEVDLELVIEQDVDRMFELLDEGEGDLIAYRLPVPKHHNEQVLFTNPLQQARQVLIQRTDGEGGDDVWDENVISNAQELAGETVHVLNQAQFIENIAYLSAEMGSEIDVIRVRPNIPHGELVRRVAIGDIDYTIMYDDLAPLEEFLHPNIEAAPVLSISQRIAWAVRNDSPSFLSHINTWLDDFQESDHHDEIYQRYFEDRVGYSNRMVSPFISLAGDQISEYDDLIREKVEANEELGWDWRLVAALIQQESRFNTYARSWAGAMGLMQLMEPTAREFGVDNIYDPEENIQGGLKFIVWLENYWKDRIPNDDERQKFILASYNTGHGHVQDARRLAEAFDGDPDTWEDVAYYLLRKSSRDYYEHEVVQHGYSRGSEPVAYVRTILNSFEHYQNLLGNAREGSSSHDTEETT